MLAILTLVKPCLNSLLNSWSAIVQVTFIFDQAICSITSGQILLTSS